MVEDGSWVVEHSPSLLFPWTTCSTGKSAEHQVPVFRHIANASYVACGIAAARTTVVDALKVVLNMLVEHIQAVRLEVIGQFGNAVGTDFTGLVHSHRKA